MGKKYFMFICNVILNAIGMLAVIYYMRNVEDDSKLEFLTRLKGPIKFDNVDLIKFVKDNVLNLPQTNSNQGFKGTVQTTAWKFYNTIIQLLYNDKLNGYFIEAGAVDGRIESNTAYLEWAKQWTGLLIEPDKQAYSLLRATKRNCWTANCCLAQHGYPVQELFATSIAEKDLILFKVFSEVVKSDSIDNHNNYFYRVQCIPLATLLMALNRTFVDLLSLDIQGGEEGVLESFPWSVITIDTLLIEHVKENGTAHHVMDKEFIKKVTSFGYRHFVYMHPWDYVFIRKGSKLERKIGNIPQNFLKDFDNIIFS